MCALSTKLIDWVTELVAHVAKGQIERVASSLCVREDTLREMAQLRLEQYVVAGKLDNNTAVGIGRAVVDELLKSFDLSKIAPRDESIRKAMSRVVTLRAVKLPTWVVLNELAKLDDSPYAANVAYEFQEDSGTKHGGNTAIYHLSDEFLFHKPLAVLDLSRARITREVTSMAVERLEGEHIHVERFEVYGTTATRNS